MGVSKRRRNLFKESVFDTMESYNIYRDNLDSIGMSMFEWQGLPSSIDQRFMERQLYYKGYVLVFADEVLGLLALPCTIGGLLDVYNNPVERTAIAANGYQRKLDIANSVLIYNNYYKAPSYMNMNRYAKKLGFIDSVIAVNVNAQKTPVMLVAGENDRNTMKALYEQYDGSYPYLFPKKGFDMQQIQALKTDAPYVADRLLEIKNHYWNEALTMLGIPNVQVEKKERLIKDEVQRSMAGSLALRYSRLGTRREAAQLINEMFPSYLDGEVSVDVRGEFAEKAYEMPDQVYTQGGVLDE